MQVANWFFKLVMYDSPSRQVINSNEKLNRIVPYGIVAFFVALTGLMGWFIWLSFSSYSGLSTEHSYEKGLDFAQINKDSIASEKYPFSVSINYDGQRVNVYFKGIALYEISKIDGKIIRPVDSKQDQDLVLNSHYLEGVRSSPIKLTPGAWEARFKISVAGKDYFFAQRIMVGN